MCLEAKPKDSSYTWQLVSIIFIAGMLRVAWATQVHVDPISDSRAYDVFARNLVNFGVFGWTNSQPFAFWPPGTSFLYAAVYWSFGENFSNIVLLNIVLSCALIVTTFRVGDRLFGRDVALVAAVLLALWPTLIMFTTILASELPFLLLTIGALDAWSMPKRTPLFKGIVAGILLGAAALVRPFAIVLPIIFAVSFVVQSSSRRVEGSTQLKTVMASFLAIVLVISPWTWRNNRLYGEPVLISTNGGITLWMGNSSGAGDAGFKDLPETLSGLNDNEQSKILGAEARRYILSDPWGFAVRTLQKMVYLYSNESVGVAWNANGIQERFGSDAIIPLKRLCQLSWGLILIFAVLGLFTCLHRRGWLASFSPVISTVAFYTLLHGIIVSQDRYHLAFAPQLAILASLGINVMGRWLATRAGRSKVSWRMPAQ